MYWVIKQCRKRRKDMWIFLYQKGFLRKHFKNAIWQYFSWYQAFQKLNLERPSFAFQIVIPKMLSLDEKLNRIFSSFKQDTRSNGGSETSNENFRYMLIDMDSSHLKLWVARNWEPHYLRSTRLKYFHLHAWKMFWNQKLALGNKLFFQTF